MLNSLKFPREINLLLLSIFIFAAAMSINLVTFPTILTKHGVSADKIGIAFTCDALGGILTSFFLSRIVAKLGMMRALIAASSVYGAVILLIFFYHSFLLWIFFAFAMGSCWFVYVISRQSWLNILVAEEKRGIVLGLFSISISAGLALGPIITRFLGADSYFSFITSALLVAISMICILPLSRAQKPQIESQRIPLIEFFRKNPRCFLGRFFLDFQTYLLMTFTVIFGHRIGLSYEASGLLITAYMASGFFDVWVGFALKKFSAYKLINVGFLICIYSFLAIILYHDSYLFLLAAYFVFGIGIACTFVSLFAIANQDYGKEKMVAANSTFQLIGSSGALCGSFIGGYLVEIFGTMGFPITIILSGIFYVTFLILHDKKFAS